MVSHGRSLERNRIVPVADEDDQGQAVPELVRTGGGLGRVGPGHLVQEPVRGSAKALLVLLTAEPLWSDLRFSRCKIHHSEATSWFPKKIPDALLANNWDEVA